MSLDFKVKGWLEKDGKMVAGAGRIRLLELIQEHGSISKVASTMNMSYRHAWGLVKGMEAVLGAKLIESRRGGKIGGKSKLTRAGKRLLADYYRGQRKLMQMV